MKLTCTKCGLIDEPKIIIKGNHHVAFCIGCGKYIKNVSYDIPKLYIGKYKGTPVSEITDIEYLKWFIKTIEKISFSTKSAISKQIEKLSK